MGGWSGSACDFLQGRGKPLRVSRIYSGGGIGQIFACARQGKVKKLGNQRSQYNQKKGYQKKHRMSADITIASSAAGPAAAPAAMKEHSCAHIRHDNNGTQHHP